MRGIGDASALRSYRSAVYHYTSSGGLLGMVTSGQLRASEASSLNDLAEVELGWQSVRQWLSKQPDSQGVSYLVDSVGSMRQDPQHQVFVLSGTTAGDDANQWRLYAEQGRGYAIEIDGSRPLAVVSKDYAEYSGFGTRVTQVAYVLQWHHVLYKKLHLDRALSALVTYVDDELTRIDQIADPEGQEHFAEVLGQEVADELATIAHLVKSRGFEGEREVRVVVRFLWFGKHVGYRAGAYGIAGHVFLVHRDLSRGTSSRVVPEPEMANAGEVDFTHPLAISGVRLGPLVHKGNKETVRAFLRAHGLRSTRVSRSRVPLR